MSRRSARAERVRTTVAITPPLGPTAVARPGPRRGWPARPSAQARSRPSALPYSAPFSFDVSHSVLLAAPDSGNSAAPLVLHLVLVLLSNTRRWLLIRRHSFQTATEMASMFSDLREYLANNTNLPTK